MKKSTLLLCLILLALSNPKTGSATTIHKYLTLEGTISSINDNAGIISDAGLSVGDSITYIVRFDYVSPGYNAAGTKTYNNGSVYTYTDSIYSGKHSTFVDYICGSLLSPKDGGCNNASTDIAEYNYTIARQHSDWGRYRDFYLGTGNSFLTFHQTFAGVQTEYLYDFRPRYWNMYGYNTVYDSEGNSSTLYFNDLEMTSMSYDAPEGYDPLTGVYTPPVQEVPVPEPTTLLLMGTAMAIWIGKIKKHSHS